MKTSLVCCAAVMMLLTVNGCERTTSKPGQPDFNANSVKLATVPAGYEMGEAVFSSDGRHVAITAIKDDKTVVFFDSKRSKGYDAVRDIVLRQGSSDYAFVARKDDKESVCVNGVEGTMFDSVGQLFFARDGRIIYEARRNEKWVIVSGKLESAPFYSDKPAPVVSSDGKRLTYTEHPGNTKKSSLRACSIDLKDCVNGKDYDSVDMLKTDSSGSQVAYIAGKDGKKAIVTVDFSQPGLIEKEGLWQDDITIFSFSAKGNHLAYLGRTENKHFIGKDGVELPAEKYDTVFEMTVSHSGRTLYSALVKGKVVAFVDGQQTGGEYNGIYTPSFSTDGSNYVFAAEKGDKSVVIINGQETPAFDKMVTPKFTPDDSKIVYRARNKGERFIVVADLQGRTIREHPHYEAVWDLVFSPDGKSVGYGVKIGQELWWKVEEL